MMTPDTLVVDTYRLKPAQVKALAKLKILTLKDLLYHFPNRHEVPATECKINELKEVPKDRRASEKVSVYGIVLSTKISKAFRKKIPLAEMTIEDETGKLKAVWFHQVYLVKPFAPGRAVKLTGVVSKRKDEIYLSNPQIEAVDELGGGTLFKPNEANEAFEAQNFLLPIYPESRGVSSAWFEYRIKQLIASGILELITDPIPPEILKKYNLPSLKTALVWLHAPQTEDQVKVARKRLAFEEIFFIQLARQSLRKKYQEHSSFKIKVTDELLKDFISRFPFTLTGAQEQTIKQILEDFTKGEPMMRLLEGDVGSGKTAVAAVTAFAVVKSGGLSVAYMVPTEILARQHFESFIQYFRHLNINIGLITGGECRKFPSKIEVSGHTHISRAQLLKWVANGDIPILIGTHTLIQKTVKFKNLAYVIIDEQHRFGVEQRAKLASRHERLPHLLSMTATPIPRTLALTVYGDLDLSLLDESPIGRKPIITEIIPESERAKSYEKIRTEIKIGRQAFVICPRIDEPDLLKELAVEAKSAKTEAERLQTKIFPEFEVGLVHSKLLPKDKEQVMADFTTGKIDILVATSVVEVGVNVPNATMIIIEGAERFGLAQLHQLRGRVLRSSHQAYCFIFSDKKSGKALERLRALGQAKSGFELAEIDLKLRGSGALAGGKQWGISDIGMEALQNLKMVEAARAEAKIIIATNPNFALPDQKMIHFE